MWEARERLPSAVPQGGAEGEVLSPTQPFPTHVPDLVPERFTLDDVHNEVDRPSSRDEGSMITSAGARESCS
jgi:quinoprotein glucose dehydrogenase